MNERTNERGHRWEDSGQVTLIETLDAFTIPPPPPPSQSSTGVLQCDVFKVCGSNDKLKWLFRIGQQQEHQ
ncbi:hypothetical protein BLOT_016715 [Blomia tropicalis]|nr:hypothetical protein BLOT_016715 [Blomia tropicalis]